MTVLGFVTLVYTCVLLLGIGRGASAASEKPDVRAMGWLWQQFALGFVCAACLLAAVEDWYGLDGWVDELRTHWINTPWWVGGAVAFGAYMAAWRCRVLVMKKTRDTIESLRKQGVL